jgi:catechol 2,3-dioxygenase-like lactoylglutathione lyase family enzyme
MVKSSKVVFIVDSVEEAVKFYTEKLSFDLIDLEEDKGGGNTLVSAHLRKDKCIVSFRAPQVEELAEFSFIKRCASRCVGVAVFMKKGIDKYYQRCSKKGLKIVSELKPINGCKEFSLRDPFGIKLIFIEPPAEVKTQQAVSVAGLSVSRADVQRDIDATVDQIVARLKPFGILRRTAKKLAKIKLKPLLK